MPRIQLQRRGDVQDVERPGADGRAVPAAELGGLVESGAPGQIKQAEAIGEKIRGEFVEKKLKVLLGQVAPKNRGGHRVDQFRAGKPGKAQRPRMPEPLGAHAGRALFVDVEQAQGAGVNVGLLNGHRDQRPARARPPPKSAWACV